MKILVPLIKESADKMVNYIRDQLESNPSTIVDGKELAAKFTTENIATCAFGVEGKCFEDPNSEFRELGRKMFETSLSRGLQMLLLAISPKIAAKLDIRFIPMPVQKRFKQLISTILEYRRQNNVVRNDFLHIINEVKDGQFMATDADIAGQAADFFVDGFETSSISMDFIMYELANNKLEQEKLRKEINLVLSKHNDCLSYEIIQEMAYLDGVCKEALRMHPPVLYLEKICSQDYVMPPQSQDGIPIEIKKGMRIVIPAYGIHMDPRYYPEPTRFDPERFLPENRSSIQKCTYLAFNEGPRTCLGRRFALMQIKIGLIYIVKNFEISINEKTIRPLKIDPIYFMNAPKGGIWYNFKKISN
ncbi:cytochrome p450 [Rhyzopertha dominica]|nr:cytochrome p450 [Rhyzopertha dominica]